MNLTAITVVATLFYHNTNPPLSIICAGDLWRVSKSVLVLEILKMRCVIIYWYVVFHSVLELYDYWNVSLAHFHFLWCLHAQHKIFCSSSCCCCANV
jgi:hypothetical protein